ncbi:MAG: peptidylprolyl isomerase [Candidatus Sedimenticola sp. (ex Thyasira tokunagai)]
MTTKMIFKQFFRNALLGTLILSSTITTAIAATEEIDNIVAIIDDDVVVRSELDNDIRTIVTQLRQSGKQLPPRSVVEKQVLDRLIMKKLQISAAERAGISVSQGVVAQALNNIARKNNLTLSQFRQALEAEGLSYASFRDSIRDQILLQRMREQQIRRHIRVTDQEVAALISRQSGSSSGRSAYHLRHILVSTPEAASPEALSTAEKRAKEIVKRLRGGADFHTIALTHSEGGKALEGGDLGWRPAEQLPSLFVDRVEKMERGEISDPIHTPSGYHIVKLADYKGGERHIITQTHTRHILIHTNEVTSDDDARGRLERLKQRIEGGDDFALLARSHSDDKGSAIKGGDLGWVNPGDLLPRYEEEMGKLEKDQLSEPFRTEFGWHLIQVLGQRQHDSTEDVLKSKAREAVRKRKTTEQTELFLRRLKDEAYIEIRLNQN